jgi:hypothetical protein
MCVGPSTCCFKLKDSRSVRNCNECASDASLICRLKSPVIRNSSGDVATEERNEQNSDRLKKALHMPMNQEGDRYYKWLI